MTYSRRKDRERRLAAEQLRVLKQRRDELDRAILELERVLNVDPLRPALLVRPARTADS